MRNEFTAIIERDGDWYIAFCTEIPGANGQGRSHSLWSNPTTGSVEAVPRHNEMSDRLVRKICQRLSLPEIGI